MENENGLEVNNTEVERKEELTNLNDQVNIYGQDGSSSPNFTMQPNVNQTSSAQSNVNQTSTAQSNVNQTSTTQQVVVEGTVVEQEKKTKKKKEKNKNSGANKVVKLVGSAAVFGLVAGGAMVGVNYAGNRLIGKNQQQVQIPTVTTADAGMQEAKPERTTGYADIAEEVMPSIVSITNTSVQTVRSWFNSYEQEVSGSGSGIIIGKNDDEILIVTNNHVIDGAKELTVAFCDKTAVSATVKGADALADLAVISVKLEDMDANTVSAIRVAAIGSSDDLRVGEGVIAIGNALGYGQSLTAGYISAMDREVNVEENSMHLLQTDAAINPGNSGGALLNTKGELIGINTMKYVDSTVEGMGYAIPISSAIPIINDLMNKQVIAKEDQGYLGIKGRDITDEYANSFDMPKGVYVVKIVEDSPADDSGLKAGDIITKFAGRDVNTMTGLQSILTGKKAGEEIEMTVQRNNEKGEYEKVTVKVVLGAKKDMPDSVKKEEEDAQKEKDSQNYQMNPDAGQGEDEYQNPGSDQREDYYQSPEDFFNNFEDFFRY